MARREQDSETRMVSDKKGLGFIDIVLILMGIGAVSFVIAVLAIFATTGNEPSTLIASVFTFITAEAAICWQITTHKHGISVDTSADISEGLDITCDPNEEGGEG